MKGEVRRKNKPTLITDSRSQHSKLYKPPLITYSGRGNNITKIKIYTKKKGYFPSDPIEIVVEPPMNHKTINYIQDADEIEVDDDVKLVSFTLRDRSRVQQWHWEILRAQVENGKLVAYTWPGRRGKTNRVVLK